MRQTGYCPDHPRRYSPLKFCMRASVREIVIYFKFNENRSRDLGAVGVENRHLPLTWPWLVVQAVMLLCAGVSQKSRSGFSRAPAYIVDASGDAAAEIFFFLFVAKITIIALLHNMWLTPKIKEVKL